MTEQVQAIKLNDGRTIPQIGLGVFRAEEGDETYNAVKWALENGYRHIDTAMYYFNEESVGRAIRDSGIAREDIFVTTKLWNDDVRAGKTREALEGSLQRLGLDYVDLYLIHWPAEGREKAWAEMEKLQQEGKIRSIGVSNFNPHHLEELAKTATVTPAVDQIESNPYFQNQDVVDYCQQHGIQVEAWSPLGGSKQTNMREDETVQRIAEAHGKTPTQVIIRWHLQRGLIVLPKSTHEEYIKENIDVLDFELNDEEMAAMKGLERGTRTGSDPDDFDF
ncbi:MAG: aldo/keto reductase [Peptoniphilaceae bacterium]|nr:aldo/keto reductase [Peptoniphilaceae bacterium]MDY6085150.1 aldo/keto reductase [Peptoniphilaceae bacterium]